MPAFVVKLLPTLDNTKSAYVKYRNPEGISLDICRCIQLRQREERTRMFFPGARSNTRGEALEIPRLGQNSQKIPENNLFLVYTAAAVLPRLREGT